MTAEPGKARARRILLIDNYDSFTYNLRQYLLAEGAECRVIRNDAVEPDALEGFDVDGLVLSPGPGDPDDAGICGAALARFAGRVPVLGVCLGHQTIAAHYGATIIRSNAPMHGKLSTVHHDATGVFQELPSPFEVTRYHSLIVGEREWPDCLVAHARTPEGEIMGLRHRSSDVEGVQFHPEAHLTAHGPALIRNFLRRVREP